MTPGRRCAHVAACSASQGVLGGECPITSRDSCTWYEPEIDRDALLKLANRMEADANEAIYFEMMLDPYDVAEYAAKLREAVGK